MAARASRALGALPPQICTLALGCNGLSGMLGHWVRLGGWYPAFSPLLFTVVAATLASSYVAKMLFAPAAVWRDLNSPATLSAVSTLPSVLQALFVRFSGQFPVLVTQLAILVGASLSSAASGWFLVVNFRHGAWPDPSWFPALLLGGGMTNMSVMAAGPQALRELMPLHFATITALYVPLLLVVAYRVLLSKTRHSVAPNAGMATLMAPSSFFTFTYISTGKPHGDAVGALLFALSTVFFVITVLLLFKRRGLWCQAFHPSYVALTFPVASTAAAALLASERLPHVAGLAARSWAAVLSAVAVVAVCGVLVRFLAFTWAAVTAAAAVNLEGVQNADKKQD